MSAHDMVLTLLNTLVYYQREKKATSIKLDPGLDQIEVEAVIGGETVRDVIPVEDPKFIIRD